MGLEASTCPSMGLSQQGKTAHLQAGWGRPGAQLKVRVGRQEGCRERS